uniref:Reverse transcriptase domain-containing protein n=1 Tax=Hypotaenidia okinawae TaxID=2861861 RepID=A0A6G1RWB8_9GRUI
MELLILAAVSRQIKDKRVIRSGQHGLTKGKSCLTNLIALYEDISRWIDDGRTMDVVYLNFSKALDTISHSTLVAKLRKYGLEDQVERWVVNWLKETSQWDSLAEGLYRAGSLRGQYWDLYYSMTWMRERQVC